MATHETQWTPEEQKLIAEAQEVIAELVAELEDFIPRVRRFIEDSGTARHQAEVASRGEA